MATGASGGIRIIYEPSIYLVGQQEIPLGGIMAFLADHNASGWTTDAFSYPEELVEIAGRLCYMSFAKPRPGGNKAYIDHILEAGHGSVLEHAVFSLIFTGVSRSLTHELVRHRSGFGFSQLSQRYVDESEVAFVVPPALAGPVRRTMEALNSRPDPHTGQVYLDRDSWWADDREIGHQWLESCEYARRKYISLVDWLANHSDATLDRTARRKAAREAARSVLPNATETKIFVTGNARAWRTFLEQRGDPAADAEMRRLAVKLCDVLKAEAPNLFADIDTVIDGDGREVVAVGHRKV